MNRKIFNHLYTAVGIALLGVLMQACSSMPEKQIQATTSHSVLKHYADIAHAKYNDSLITAQALEDAIDAMLNAPSETSLLNARNAWIASRSPYQQTEVYRFGNAIVDDWEGRVNAWPLDEGLIDYVDSNSYGDESDENSLYTANVIANKALKIDGKSIDASNITPALLQNQLQEAGGVESNVATGYHAIEFLLWGQDLNGNKAGHGERPYTDFSLENCTNGNCERRRAYLEAAVDLLIDDLEEMVGNWEEDGAARKALADNDGLRAIFQGMGSLSYGELAGERMKLGLLLGDPEEEHDCFSDNTHYSHFYDVLGIQNVYLGQYKQMNGQVLKGPSISELVAQTNPELNSQLMSDLKATVDAMQTMVDRAESTEAYDQMIANGNEEGNAVVQAAIDALVQQTKSIERAIAALDLGQVELEGSDSLDNPNAVFE